MKKKTKRGKPKQNVPMYPNLEAEIIRQGRTHADISLKIGINPSTFSEKINGKTKPLDIEQCKIMSVELNESLDYLFMCNSSQKGT